MKGIRKDIAYAFHCSRCGGLTEPGHELCPYCSQQTDEYFSASGGIRVVVGGIYINSVYAVEDYIAPKTIETTSLTDEFKMYVAPIARPDPVFTIKCLMDKHLVEQADFFNTKKGLDVKVELPDIKSAFHFVAQPLLGTVAKCVDVIPEVNLDFRIEDVSGWKEYKMPNYLICPNCGAVINFAFGCCAYCGGWVEWRVE